MRKKTYKRQRKAYFRKPKQLIHCPIKMSFIKNQFHSQVFRTANLSRHLAENNISRRQHPLQRSLLKKRISPNRIQMLSKLRKMKSLILSFQCPQNFTDDPTFFNSNQMSRINSKVEAKHLKRMKINKKVTRLYKMSQSIRIG